MIVSYTKTSKTNKDKTLKENIMKAAFWEQNQKPHLILSFYYLL